MPRVGERIAFKGFYIERAYFYTSYGITPKTKAGPGGLIMSPQYDKLSSKYPHDYEMGRLESAYNAPGVIDIVGFYPMTGQLSRKLVLPSKMNKGPLDAIAAKTKFIISSPTDRKGLISLDQMTIPIAASLEGAILTGRFIPLADVGSGDVYNPEQEAMEKIISIINKGGGFPLDKNTGNYYKIFWQNTEDWFFHVDKDTQEKLTEAEYKANALGVDINEVLNNDVKITNRSNGKPDKIDKTDNQKKQKKILGTTVKIENAADEDILYPPMPDSDEDDTNNSMGMVSW